MKKTTKTKTGFSPETMRAIGKANQARVDAFMRHARENGLHNGEKIIRELIQLEYESSEFVMDLDSIVTTTKPQTLPVEITLDAESWLMIARSAKHRKRSYGKVISDVLNDLEAQQAICGLADEDKGAK